MKNTRVQKMTAIALLGAIAFIIAFIEIPVPLSPNFVKMDLSDVPALIGSLMLGPVVGILIEAIKNGLQLLSTSTGGIGELANFLMGASFVGTVGYLYKLSKNFVMSCILGSVTMGIVAALANYFILFPLYSMFMPLNQVIEAFGIFVPIIKTKLDVVLYSALPFNILKGIIVGCISIIIYKRIGRLYKYE